MAEIPFLDYCRHVEELLGRKYGIRVVTRHIPDPLTGDLDGLEIHVDSSVTPEKRLFLVAHLFGHTVQWNIDPAAFDLGRQYRPPVKEDLFPTILAYEREAAEYGLSLLHEGGIQNLDEWFSVYSACDQAYLLHYYRTGQKGIFHSFRPETVPPIVPKPVPAFRPIRRTFRLDGVVI